MDNLARSRRLVTALRKVCPEFNPEWCWANRMCLRCLACGHMWANSSVADIGCACDSPTETLDKGVCICPDLLAPAHLADLFAVCRAIGYVRTSTLEVSTAEITTPKGTHFVESVTLSEALMRAAEAALGCGEEVAGG